MSDDPFPPLPNPSRCDDGYDWMGGLSGGWQPVPDWNDADLGDWPFVVVAIYLVREKGVYGQVAVWLEGGDVELTTHTTREDFRERLTEIQARYSHD